MGVKSINSVVNIEQLSKDYSDLSGYTIHLLENVNLKIKENAITTILAPTGAGKSSLLKIIAGLESPSNGEVISNIQKKIFIPSTPSSFPWLSVRENILFNLSNIDESGLQEVIKLVGLEGYKDHYPNNKSLGFRFRISLARAIMISAELIIIDEAFTKMRDEVKSRIYSLLRKLIIEKKVTIVLGTSNITEAILLSDRIYLMDKNPGRIIDSVEVKFTDPIRKEYTKSGEFSEIREKIRSIFTQTNPDKILNVSF